MNVSNNHIIKEYTIYKVMLSLIKYVELNIKGQQKSFEKIEYAEKNGKNINAFFNNLQCAKIKNSTL